MIFQTAFKHINLSARPKDSITKPVAAINSVMFLLVAKKYLAFQRFTKIIIYGNRK